MPLLLSLLAVALAGPAWADPPRAPTLAVVDPVTPPRPTPADVLDLPPGRFELVKVAGYAGKVTWRALNPFVAVTKLAPKTEVWFVPPVAGTAVSVDKPAVTVLLGLKAGAAAGSRHVVGDEPSVLLRPVGTGESTVEAWGVNAEGEPYTLLSLRVRVGLGPQPPPRPDDPPAPGPAPDGTSPFPDPGFRVLVVWDAANTTRPAAQNSVLYGRAVRDYLKARCAAEPSPEAGTDGRAYRFYPANADVSRAPKGWADAHRLATSKGKDWVLIGDGRRGYSGPLPATEADMLALLRKYGGE